jgi:septum formation topological specificity factor MinE
MFEKLFWFGIGFLVARYVILNTPDYRVKEASEIDKIRNDVHDLIKKYVPSADDVEVSNDVMTILPSK